MPQPAGWHHRHMHSHAWATYRLGTVARKESTMVSRHRRSTSCAESPFFPIVRRFPSRGPTNGMSTTSGPKNDPVDPSFRLRGTQEDSDQVWECRQMAVPTERDVNSEWPTPDLCPLGCRGCRRVGPSFSIRADGRSSRRRSCIGSVCGLGTLARILHQEAHRTEVAAPYTETVRRGCNAQHTAS